MQERYTDKDYSKYTFEDFLQDDFFISSINYPDDISIQFWEESIAKGKIELTEFIKAKDFLQEFINEHQDVVTDEDISALWKYIENTNEQSNIYTTKYNKFRKRLYIGISIAASILILFIALPRIVKNAENDQDQLMSYVEVNKGDVNSDSDVKLVLSDQNVISVKEKNVDIVYDNDEIKVSEKEIPKKESSVFNQLIVPKGKRSRLTLSDGTVMHVNSGTRVIYPNEFAGNNREVYVDGEIYIEVAPDKSRPFIIKTKDVDVQVLGTKFNVMAYESESYRQIVLVSGSVQIMKKDKNTVLKPSEMYNYNNERESVVKVDASKYISWIDGIYHYDSESLDVVMRRLSRYYGIDIIYEEGIASQKCTGKMDLKDNLGDILQGLSFSFPINIEYDNEKYTITMK